MKRRELREEGRKPPRKKGEALPSIFQERRRKKWKPGVERGREKRRKESGGWSGRGGREEEHSSLLQTFIKFHLLLFFLLLAQAFFTGLKRA